MPGLAVRRHRVATFYCFNCPTADLDPTSTPTPNRNVQIAPSDTSADCAYHHQNALRSGETPEDHIYDAHPSATVSQCHAPTSATGRPGYKAEESST